MTVAIAERYLPSSLMRLDLVVPATRPEPLYPFGFTTGARAVFRLTVTSTSLAGSGGVQQLASSSCRGLPSST